MKKLVTVLGARPQFIKASILSQKISTCEIIQEVIVHTGQHFDASMSDIFFDELKIPSSNYNLGINGGSQVSMISRMMLELEKVFIKEEPDVVLVYGDTNSTLAGALVAAKMNIKLAHVEAGLRSNNNSMPEETNRIITDRVSDYLFVPTLNAKENLLNEGVTKDKIFSVGDVMYDLALSYQRESHEDNSSEGPLDLRSNNFILATIHRAENTLDRSRMEIILGAFEELAKKIKIIWPLHPGTKKKLLDHGFSIASIKNLEILEPVGFKRMMDLVSCSQLVITDSGGLQKEAFFNKTPCLTLRDETEWVELVEAGWNVVCPPEDQYNIVRVALRQMESEGKETFPYGHGDASEKILNTLANI